MSTTLSTRSGKQNKENKQMRLSMDPSSDMIMKEISELKTEILELKSSWKQANIQDVVNKALSTALKSVSENIRKEVVTEVKGYVKEQTDQLQQHLNCIELDVANLQDEIGKRDKKIEEIQDILLVQQRKINEGILASNRNEQYSRKNNIRIRGLPETQNENLREDFTKKLQQITGVHIDGYYDIVAIHRIPSRTTPRQVIVKFFNSDIKYLVMKNRQTLRKAGIYVSEDITKRNIQLIDKVGSNDKVEYGWYYNCQVYGLCSETKRRVRFNLFDNIDSVLSEHIQDSKNFLIQRKDMIGQKQRQHQKQVSSVDTSVLSVDGSDP